MILCKRHGLIGIAVLFAAFGAAAQKYPGDGGVPLDVPYVATPQKVVDRMLQIAGVGPDDIHYDLGSGDGRIVVTAARDFKVKKGIGVDLDPVRIAEANANAQTAGVSDRVRFLRGDLFEMDFKEATVLTMYLLPEVNLKLRPRILEDLKPGSRVVSHSFTMGEWPADKFEVVDGHTIYFWVVPAKVDGTWEWQTAQDTYRLTVEQKFQDIAGVLKVGAGEATLGNAVLKGDTIAFEATVPRGGVTEKLRFSGKVSGGAIVGTVEIDGQSNNVTAKRL